MKKKGKKDRNKAMSDQELTKKLPENHQDAIQSVCPYTTPVITVRVSSGDEKRSTFSIHEGILSRCARLGNLNEDETVDLGDTEPGTFELVSSFLYTDCYQIDHSSTSPKLKDRHIAARELKVHSLLYCFATRYGLEDLVRLATANIETLAKVTYREFLDIAKTVYPKLPKDDMWYRGYFKNVTRDAMKDNRHLVQEPYVIDVFGEEQGRLISDIFLTITHEAIYQAASQDPPFTKMPTSKATVLEDSLCDQRSKHLTALEGSGPWKNCQKCRLERDVMMTTGRAIVSVVFADIWPTFCEQIGAMPDDKPQKGGKRSRKKLRQALREAVCHVPIDRATHAILAQDGHEQCPEQSEHLKQREGKWLWESCSRCLNDREMIRRQLHDLGIGKYFSNTIEAAQTPKVDVLRSDGEGASKKKGMEKKENYIEEEELAEVTLAVSFHKNGYKLPEESIQEAETDEDWDFAV